MSEDTRREHEKFHTKTFENTTEDRRSKLLSVAIAEFAQKGFQGTNVNIIAKKAGISVGALYRYFPSKDDLFLSIVSQQKTILGDIIQEMKEEEDIISQIRQMFELSRTYGLKYQELSQIYLDITTQPLADLASRLSEDMEKAIADHLVSILEQAKMKGEISDNIDVQVTAFCIDNLMIMYQLAHSSTYFKRRLAVYIGEDRVQSTEDLIQPIMAFIVKQL